MPPLRPNTTSMRRGKRLVFRRRATRLKPLFLFHHLGLGDHIICNALYRALSSRYQFLIMVVKKRNSIDVKAMLHDLDNVWLIEVSNKFADTAQLLLLKFFSFTNVSKVLSIGGASLERELGSTASGARNFDRLMYRLGQVEFKLRNQGFFIERNYVKELELFRFLGCHQGEYIFVHDDPSRDFLIEETKLPKDVRVIRSKKLEDYTIFDYLTVLEKAEEIHVVQSSFAALVECSGLTGRNFVHLYSRPDSKGEENEMSYSQQWTKLK